MDLPRHHACALLGLGPSKAEEFGGLDSHLKRCLERLAALSAGHLAALLFPAHLRRLYIVCDNDPAGDSARDSLVARAHEVGIEAITLSPMLGDFNDDLVTRGLDALRAHIRVQLAPEDVSRYMTQDHLTRQSG